MTKRMTRRGFVKAGTAAVAAPYVSAARAQSFTNDPGARDTVTLALLVPLTGAFADESQEQVRGFELALEHINGGGDGGMLQTLRPLKLDGAGVLGKRVLSTLVDTQTRAAVAAEAANIAIERDRATAVMGAGTSQTASVLLQRAQRAGVIYMMGSVTDASLTDQQRSRFGFRHYINDPIGAVAIAGFIVREYGPGRNVMQVVPQYPSAVQGARYFRQAGERQGLKVVLEQQVGLGQSDYSQVMTQVINAEIDTIVFHGTGRQAVDFFVQVRAFGLDQRAALVCPLLSPSLARALSADGIRVHGAVNWDWSLRDDGTVAFVKGFAEKYGSPPSPIAHTAYLQAVLYANACQTVGTFDPEGVWEALEGFRFAGTGNGDAVYNGSDHQAYQQSYIITTASESASSEFDLVEANSCVCLCAGTDVCRESCCSSEWNTVS